MRSALLLCLLFHLDGGVEFDALAPAKLALRGPTRADALKSLAALVFDRQKAVRDEALRVLVADGYFSVERAKSIPPLLRLQAVLKQATGLDFTDCQLELTASNAPLRAQCEHSSCARACVHRRVVAVVELSVAPRVVSRVERLLDDGTCGCCEAVE